MTRFYIIEDGTIRASCPDRETAIDMIRDYQARQDHYMLRSEYSIIAGEEEFISYPKPSRKKKAH